MEKERRRELEGGREGGKGRGPKLCAAHTREQEGREGREEGAGRKGQTEREEWGGGERRKEEEREGEQGGM